MLAEPIFSREALILPSLLRHFLMRSGYVTALFVLMYTAGQAMFGWQQVRNIGDIAQFGNRVFQMFSLVQLSLVMFFALLFAAGRVAQEKDRQTLVLLLMTDMRNRELVLGKLFSSLLVVAVLLGASLPVFVFVYMLGGVGLDQIAWSLTICFVTALAAGSWGSLVAFWREKTFQTLAISVLGMFLFLGVLEAVITVAGGDSAIGRWAALLEPYRVLFQVLDPLGQSDLVGEAIHVSALPATLALVLLSIGLNAVTIFRLRVWNPTRSTFDSAKAGDDEGVATPTKAASREIWRNPVVWREIRTRAYGRKVFVVKLAYIALAVFSMSLQSQAGSQGELILGMISPDGFALIGLSLISLMLINAQAVTAFTSERDAKTLELLLVTDVTAKEFIYGKLGGILYNSKELILVPLGLAFYDVMLETISWENFFFVAIGFLVLVGFTSMLGLHTGLSFDESRSSIAVSLGTMFFLFIGIFIFMILLVEARSSFKLQFPSFIVFILFGSIGLWATLTHKIPSPALTLSALVLPFLTFYSITQFVRDKPLGACLAISAAYGFTTLGMLIPAVSDFDVALGRTSADRG